MRKIYLVTRLTGCCYSSWFGLLIPCVVSMLAFLFSNVEGRWIRNGMEITSSMLNLRLGVFMDMFSFTLNMCSYSLPMAVILGVSSCLFDVCLKYFSILLRTLFAK